MNSSNSLGSRWRRIRALVVKESLQVVRDPASLVAAFVLPAVTGLITWYVLFGLVQQGLRQVKDEQVAHLQGTLANVEATLGLGTVRPPMRPAPVA